jgi:hypothetical protein
MLAGVILAPAATPALIWVTVAADLPLALVILQLLVMAAVSHSLTRITIRALVPAEEWPQS